MITQNLFSTRPKTFMDYAPGKVPSKNEWNTQTTKNETFDPFASNVKLVGDDMTEKDYDDFFEGFKSTNDKPLREEPKLLQTPKAPTLSKRSLLDTDPKRKTTLYNPVFGSETRNQRSREIPSFSNESKIQTSLYHPSNTNETKIEFLPYRPLTGEEVKFQPFPYMPAKDGQARVINYSATVPQNIQAKNTSQNSEDTWWDKALDEIKEPWVDRKNLFDELARMYDDLSPEVKSAIKTVLNPWTDRDDREEANKILENEVMKIHYARNQYNVNLPKNREEAEAWGWETELANCHQNTSTKDKEHIKYISPDGKREVIFDYTGTKVITADEDVGTYNYADPDLWLAHFVVDILPWFRYGNTPEDTTEWYERLGGFLGVKN